MDDKFLCGVCLGMIGGALLIANSNKARKAVIDGQEKILEKIEDLNSKTEKTQK